MDLNLLGKNALVGGSSRGIGRAAAFELAALGANVTLVSRSVDKMSELIGELPVQGKQNHDFLMADFSNPQDLKKRILGLSSGKKIHILINNTGGPPGGPILDAEPEEFLKAFQQHLIANQTLVKTLVKDMRSEGYGRIVNVISTSVKQPISGLGVSNTIRAAVANWAKTLANELGPEGITVNNVLPGFTKTGRLGEIIQSRSSKQGRTPEEIAEEMKKIVPLRRFADPSEVGAAIAWLCTPAAAYITGTNLVVDGGRTKSW